MRLVSFRNVLGLAPVLIGVLLLSLIAFAIVGWLHFDERVRAYQLLDDTTSYAGVKWYTGLFSYLGVLLWCASAAVCGFAALLLREHSASGARNLATFLAVLAAANLWMTFDDLFVVHEQLARLFAGEASQHAIEGVIFFLYAVLLAICFWWFRETIAHTEYALLIAAIVSLVASMAIDVGFQLEMDGNHLFRETVLSVSWGPPVIDIAEEILKLNGAMLWFVYLVRTGLAGVRDWIDSAVRVPARTSHQRAVNGEASVALHGAMMPMVSMSAQDEYE